MAIKRTSLQDVFRRSGREMLRDALSDNHGGLLDEFPCYPVASSQAALREPEKGEAQIQTPRKIHYPLTSDEMIRDGELILKDGRRVTSRR